MLTSTYSFTGPLGTVILQETNRQMRRQKEQQRRGPAQITSYPNCYKAHYHEANQLHARHTMGS